MVRGGGCTLASDTAAGLSGMIGWRLHVRIPPMMAWGGEQLFPPAVFELSWLPGSLSAGWVTVQVGVTSTLYGGAVSFAVRGATYALEMPAARLSDDYADKS